MIDVLMEHMHNISRSLFDILQFTKFMTGFNMSKNQNIINIQDNTIVICGITAAIVSNIFFIYFFQ